MIDAATTLIRRNKWQIFHCTADEAKAPIVKRNTSWQDRSNSVKPTHDVLQLARKGKKLVACVVPPDVFVVDIDKKGDEKRLNKAVKENLLKTTLVVESGRGYHLYYLLPKKLKITKLKGKIELFENIDLRKNCYMIIPPSLHYLGKQHYTQINNGFDTPQKVPKSLMKLLRKCERQLVSEKDYLTEKDIDKLADGKPGQPYISNEHLQLALDALPTDAYNSLEDFFRLCASVHHATGGNKKAREIFIEWARGDSEYNDRKCIENNRRIWDNCK